MPNDSWQNSRYGPQYMHWSEAQQVWLPDLGKYLGPAFFHLKKLWAKYKRLGREGGYRGDVAALIQLYQRNLDLPISDLPEISEYEYEQQEQVQGTPNIEQEALESTTGEGEAHDDWNWDLWEAGDGDNSSADDDW